jgi:hypothetical protein
MENGTKASQKVLELRFGQMAGDTKAIGSKASPLARESKLTRMATQSEASGTAAFLSFWGMWK